MKSRQPFQSVGIVAKPHFPRSRAVVRRLASLLDSRGAVSDYTRDTLARLSDLGVAYTVATGRTLHAARELLAPHGFRLPQVYKNGVMIWDPASDVYSHSNFLTLAEVEHVLDAVLEQGVAPFVFTLEPGNRHAIYHTPLQSDIERKLAEDFGKRAGVAVRRPRVVFCAGEYADTFTRRLVKIVFGTEPVGVYGQSEVGYIAWQCEQR